MSVKAKPSLKMQQLRYVLAVADKGSFHAAAKALHRTQPALSLGIKELELRLGERLFEKHPSAKLTPFGEVCLPRFKELAGLHDRVARDLDDLAGQRASRIEIATVPSIARRFMPNVLNRFIRAYPAINIELHDGPAEWVCQLVRTGSIEFGVGSLSGPTDELHFEPLLEDALGVVCHISHPLADANKLNWPDLMGHQLLRNGTSRMLEDTPASVLLANSRFYITEMISIIAMLETGKAYTTLPRLAFQEEYSSLRFIPLSNPMITRQIGLISRAGASHSSAAETMMAALREQCRTG